MAYQNPLARLMPSSMDVDKMKREGWQKERILVVCADDPKLDFILKEFVIKIGNLLYGHDHASNR